MGTNLVNKMHYSKPAPMRMQVAHNALDKATGPKPVFFIERASIHRDKAEVFYIDDLVLSGGMPAAEDWKVATISRANLEAFALAAYSDRDTCCDILVSEFIEYNLYEVAKAYLEAGKESSHV